MIETLRRAPSRGPADVPPLPQQLARLDVSRLRAYRENLDFYHGQQWLEPRRRERRLTFNYAKTIVEKMSQLIHWLQSTPRTVFPHRNGRILSYP